MRSAKSDTSGNTLRGWLKKTCSNICFMYMLLQVQVCHVEWHSTSATSISQAQPAGGARATCGSHHHRTPFTYHSRATIPQATCSPCNYSFHATATIPQICYKQHPLAPFDGATYILQPRVSVASIMQSQYPAVCVSIIVGQVLQHHIGQASIWLH